MGVTLGLVQSRSKKSQGMDTQRGWLALEGSIAFEERQFGFGMSIPLP